MTARWQTTRRLRRAAWRRRAWSTRRTTCRRRPTPATSRPPRFRATTRTPTRSRPGTDCSTSPSRCRTCSRSAAGVPSVEPDRDRTRRRPAAAPAGRRGTQDLGLLLLRVGFGALLIAHGLQKAFGWWGGQGLDGFEQSLSDTGLPARQHPHLRRRAAPRSAPACCWCSDCSRRWPRRPRWPT